MKFVDLFASGGLMEAVDILGDNCKEFAFLFPLRQLQMRLVGLGVQRQKFVTVELEEFFTCRKSYSSVFL